MSTVRGGSLENAIARAARKYRAEGRDIVLVQQFPRVNAAGVMISGAPLDFIGCDSGRALAIEAKQVGGASLPCSRLRDDQMSLMGIWERCEGEAYLVVEFTDFGEVYIVKWEELATFLAAPWRKSWPLTWFKAYGSLIPIVGDEAHRIAQFVDAGPHPERDAALAEIEKEREGKPVLDLDDGTRESSKKTLESFKGLTKEERDARIMNAARAGIDRQRKKYQPKWAKRRA